MGKVTAWQCIHCESLFAEKNLMENHRRRCAKETKERIDRENRRQEAIKRANELRLEVETPSDILDRIESIAKDMGAVITFSNWNLRFSTCLSATHNAPIGKPTEWNPPQGVERTKYLGWTGQIKGYTSLWKDPIKDEIGAFGKIDGFSDFVEAYCTGIHTGTGGGGDNFYFGITIYLDDFPKLKENYELWKVESEKRLANKKKYDELRKKAISNLIDENDRIVTLNDIEIILNARIKQIHTERYKLRDEITKSDEFVKATTLSEEYNYDSGIYYQYEDIFTPR